MNLRKGMREEPKVFTLALNDILFILLFFFLVIATLANPNVIKLSIPKAESDTKANQTVVVSIDANQKFYIGTTEVDPLYLPWEISRYIENSQDIEPTIVINADQLATADNIVTVMKAAQELKVRTVLAVDEE
ncbi:MAG TPA: biopolymer transporter ExbD [Chitinophagaceae bacterium]|nr:biopolymer transporter ExbD [Chitinophagaceae bacterium]